MDRPDFPSAAADRVFAQLLAMFGAQRMAVAWGDVPEADRRAVWSGAIGRAVWNPARGAYDLEAIKDALGELASTTTKGPPSAGEFADRCARFAQRPGRMVRQALPLPRRTDDELERGRAHLERIRGIVGRGAARRQAAEPTELPPIELATCTCRRGNERIADPSTCPACGSFAAHRARTAAMRSSTTEGDPS